MKFVGKVDMELADGVLRFYFKCEHAHQVAETNATRLKSPVTSVSPCKNVNFFLKQPKRFIIQHVLSQ